ncbi:thermonuclease family protein [Rhodococcus sp. 077-4]|uniref:thermonuclease family protein n=1 Tax=Rhodococcus sp. 077-4 TaxID=2789271 RepID=UPI0039F45BFA
MNATANPVRRQRRSMAAAPWAALALAALVSGCVPETVLGPVAAAMPASTSGVVERVVDGDTVDVRLATGGDPVRVRILGIDTPETVDPDAPVGCWGPEASTWAHQLLDHADVTLTGDPALVSDYDRYDRLLRYVELPDGSNYSVVAADAGMARAYIFGDQRLTEAANITAAQANAQHAGAGLWGAPCYGRTAPS